MLVGDLGVFAADVLVGGVEVGGDVPAGIGVFGMGGAAALLGGEDFFAEGGGVVIAVDRGL